MTLDDFVDRQDLIDQVITQLALDFENKDVTAIEELLKAVPDENLIAYLPKE